MNFFIFKIFYSRAQSVELRGQPGGSEPRGSVGSVPAMCIEKAMANVGLVLWVKEKNCYRKIEKSSSPNNENLASFLYIGAQCHVPARCQRQGP